MIQSIINFLFLQDLDSQTQVPLLTASIVYCWRSQARWRKLFYPMNLNTPMTSQCRFQQKQKYRVRESSKQINISESLKRIVELATEKGPSRLLTTCLIQRYSILPNCDRKHYLPSRRSPIQLLGWLNLLPVDSLAKQPLGTANSSTASPLDVFLEI